MFKDQNVDQVEDVHDAIVDDEPDVIVIFSLILREDVSEWNHPGIVEKTHRHNGQPTWQNGYIYSILDLFSLSSSMLAYTTIYRC